MATSSSGVGIGMETMMCQKAPIIRGYCPVRAASTVVVVGTAVRITVASPSASTTTLPTAASIWVFVSLGFKKSSRLTVLSFVRISTQSTTSLLVRHVQRTRHHFCRRYFPILLVFFHFYHLEIVHYYFDNKNEKIHR